MPIDILRSFSERRASLESVMRALVEYPNWLVPTLYLEQIMGMSVSERVTMFSERVNTPNRQLWLFTDDAHAHLAQRQKVELGLYATNVPGQLIFETLSYTSLDALHVNAFAPPSEAWVISHENFALSRMWSQALSLEAMLRSPNWEDPTLLRALKLFGGYQALFRPNNTIVTAVGASGPRSPALLFTTPDSLARYQSEMSQGQGFSVRTFDGLTLCNVSSRADVDGFILNVRGPGPTVMLPLSACERARTI